jgi:hypothetical protein
MVGLRWAPNEKWAVLASGLRDIKFLGDFEHFEASYKVAEGVSAKVAGDRLNGQPETPLGTYKRNSRVMLSLNMQK